MRNIFISLFCLLTLGTHGQSTQLTEVVNLIDSYLETEDVNVLTQAQEDVYKLLKDKSLAEDPHTLTVASKVNTLVLSNTAVAEPFKLCDEIEASYLTAFAHDDKMLLRNDMLNAVYDSKSAMRNKGNEAYEAEKFDEAYMYYQKALKLNEIEVANPRYAARDYSLLYTSAVFANISGKKSEAAIIFEELIGIDYPRVDMYDTLIAYYKEMNLEKEVNRIDLLKKKRFPEVKQ